MTLEEQINAASNHLQKVGDQVDNLKEEKRKAARDLEALVQRKAAADVVEGMSDSQKAALAQALQVTGIESGTEFGKIG